MGIAVNFTMSDIARLMEKKRVNIESAIIRRLQYLGEQCVNEARTNGDYTDRTGNLRSSVGYVVVARGQIVNRNFASSSGGEGVAAGTELAESLAAQHTTGYALIVVAGMSYALYVEAKFHRNVLSSAESYAEQKLPIMMAQLKGKIT